MAIKALKQNVSIREIQKMIHQWKAWGVSDSACLKLLDLYLGMPHFMNEDGVYPIKQPLSNLSGTKNHTYFGHIGIHQKMQIIRTGME